MQIKHCENSASFNFPHIVFIYYYIYIEITLRLIFSSPENQLILTNEPEPVMLPFTTADFSFRACFLWNPNLLGKGNMRGNVNSRNPNPARDYLILCRGRKTCTVVAGGHFSLFYSPPPSPVLFFTLGVSRSRGVVAKLKSAGKTKQLPAAMEC